MLAAYGYLACCGVFQIFVLSLALNNAQNSGSLYQTSPTQNLTLPQLLLLNQNITTILREGKVHCDDALYGNPPVDSCKDAVGQIPQDLIVILQNKKRSYGPRHVEGVGPFDVQLPKRYISCEFFLAVSGIKFVFDCGTP